MTFFSDLMDEMDKMIKKIMSLFSGNCPDFKMGESIKNATRLQHRNHLKLSSHSFKMQTTREYRRSHKHVSKTIEHTQRCISNQAFRLQYLEKLFLQGKISKRKYIHLKEIFMQDRFFCVDEERLNKALHHHVASIKKDLRDDV